MSKRPRQPQAPCLPDQADFIAPPYNIDQGHAWLHFGGLSLDQARERFAEHAAYYQEDFMFMGARAFLYYFPVLGDHLRGPRTHENDDREAWIIARGILSQLERDQAGELASLRPTLLETTRFVLGKLHHFGPNAVRQRVARAWKELRRKLESLERASAPGDMRSGPRRNSPRIASFRTGPRHEDD